MKGLSIILACALLAACDVSAHSYSRGVGIIECSGCSGCSWGGCSGCSGCAGSTCSEGYEDCAGLCYRKCMSGYRPGSTCFTCFGCPTVDFTGKKVTPYFDWDNAKRDGPHGTLQVQCVCPGFGGGAFGCELPKAGDVVNMEKLDETNRMWVTCGNTDAWPADNMGTIREVYGSSSDEWISVKFEKHFDRIGEVRCQPEKLCVGSSTEINRLKAPINEDLKLAFEIAGAVIDVGSSVSAWCSMVPSWQTACASINAGFSFASWGTNGIEGFLFGVDEAPGLSQLCNLEQNHIKPDEFKQCIWSQVEEQTAQLVGRAIDYENTNKMISVWYGYLNTFQEVKASLTNRRTVPADFYRAQDSLKTLAIAIKTETTDFMDKYLSSADTPENVLQWSNIAEVHMSIAVDNYLMSPCCQTENHFNEVVGVFDKYIDWFNVDVELSGSNDNTAMNLKACTGECDSDSQCADGLHCFQRNNGEKIPGCKGEGNGKDWDYCYEPSSADIELSGSNDHTATNLQACIGECDADSQCAAGLKCFQRSNGETIPGCKGEGAGKDWDYCYDPNSAVVEQHIEHISGLKAKRMQQISEVKTLGTGGFSDGSDPYKYQATDSNDKCDWKVEIGFGYSFHAGVAMHHRCDSNDRDELLGIAQKCLEEHREDVRTDLNKFYDIFIGPGGKVETWKLRKKNFINNMKSRILGTELNGCPADSRC